MKAIVYNGPRDVQLKEMPDPALKPQKTAAASRKQRELRKAA